MVRHAANGPEATAGNTAFSAQGAKAWSQWLQSGPGKHSLWPWASCPAAAGHMPKWRNW